MKVNRKKLDCVLAEQCKVATDLRGTLAPATITRIRRGDDVNTRTVGKLARALNVPLEQILEQEAR